MAHKLEDGDALEMFLSRTWGGCRNHKSILHPIRANKKDMGVVMIQNKEEPMETAINQTPKDSTVEEIRIRKLTPLECWRLMGFDDAAFKRAEETNSNSQLYKQAGNSIVVDVLEYIFGMMV